MRKCFLFMALCGHFMFHYATAQDSVRWASHQVENMPIGRGLDISYTTIFNSTLEAESEVSRINNNEADLSRLENMEFDLKFPIVVGDQTQFIGSIEYTFDHLTLKNFKEKNYEFFDIINNKQLRSRKLKLYLTHSFNSTNYLKIRASAELNGDVSDSDDSIYEFAKYSLSATYGWQKSKNNAYGVGLFMDYTLGRPSIYPVFEWNKTWNDRWGFESKLPAQFNLRFTPRAGTRLYMGYSVSGISYRLVSEEEETTILDEFEVRRSDVKLSLNLEKRIYDFLWMGIESGLNYNIRFEVADNDRLYDNEEIIAGQISPAPFAKFSLFIVPSQSLKRFFGYSDN